jgi:hypothetical protein
MPSKRLFRNTPWSQRSPGSPNNGLTGAGWKRYETPGAPPLKKTAHAALDGVAYRKSGGVGHPGSWQGNRRTPCYIAG